MQGWKINAWHARRSFFQIHWIYFMFSSGGESVWNWDAFKKNKTKNINKMKTLEGD